MKQTIFTPAAALKTESAVLNGVSESATAAATVLLNKAAERETAAYVKTAAAYSDFSRSVVKTFTAAGRGAKPLIVGGQVYNLSTLHGFLTVTGKKLSRRAFRECTTVTPTGVTFRIDIRYTAAESRRIRTTAAVIAAHVEKKTVKTDDLTRKEALGW